MIPGPLEHLALALVLQVLCVRLGGSWWLGAVAAGALFIGREFTQAEYRAIEHYYGGLRANAPWFAGFEPRAWSLKSLLDWLLPLLAVATLAWWRESRAVDRRR